MSSPDAQSPQPEKPDQDPVRDRVYRSPAGIAGGVLLLAVAGWFGIDAVISGEGRTPWLALAALLLLVPLVIAFTVRPAVYAGHERLRIRNPFRVIVLPWGRVAALRSGYSNEVVAESGTKYQLWALPVSLRARKRAARQEMRAQAQRGEGVDVRATGRGPGVGSAFRSGGAASQRAVAGPVRSTTDQAMDELRELHEAGQEAAAAQGEVTVRWAYEILAPAGAGAVLLAVLLAVA
ncbi:PH domain-containing protein [Streptomyces sp. 15-116A]|uniref:PH domain-containing protein n=1 Tax=Streptomyces sp. 15-116A TaxID=2259035 RepID=UPI0021B3DC8F|nr:PH domain-containing protein [Streptomyces sp. 15-116A]MCT7356283.1 PH domain-containing protein [Streptomyces sp. 15-116A]